MLRALTLSLLLPLALASENKTDVNNSEDLTQTTANFPVFHDEENLLKLEIDKSDKKTTLLELSDGAKKIEQEWGYFFTFWNTLWWLGGAPIMYIGADTFINLAFLDSHRPEGWFMWTSQGEGKPYVVNDFVLAITYIWLGFTIIELIVLAIACKYKQDNKDGDKLKTLCGCYPELWIGRCITPLGCLPCCHSFWTETLLGGDVRKKTVLDQLVKNANGSVKAAQLNEWKVIASTFACFWWLAVIPLIGTLWAYCNALEHHHTEWLGHAIFFAEDADGNEVPSPFIWILFSLWTIGTSIACIVSGQAFHQQGENSKFLGCCDYDAKEMAMRFGNFWACGSLDKLGQRLFGREDQRFKDAKGGIFCCCFSCGGS